MLLAFIIHAVPIVQTFLPGVNSCNCRFDRTSGSPAEILRLCRSSVVPPSGDFFSPMPLSFPRTNARSIGTAVSE